MAARSFFLTTYLQALGTFAFAFEIFCEHFCCRNSQAPPLYTIKNHVSFVKMMKTSVMNGIRIVNKELHGTFSESQQDLWMALRKRS